MIRAFLLMLFVFTSAFGFECPEPGIYFGGDLNSPIQTIKDVDSALSCGKICYITTTCQYWNWASSMDCYLYASRSGLEDDSTYQGGERDCPCVAGAYTAPNITMDSAPEGESRISCPETASFFGAYPKQTIIDVTSWQDCSWICTLTNNCEYWSFDEESQDEGSDCYLYEQRQDLQFDSNYVSGDRSCSKTRQCGGGGDSGVDPISFAPYTVTVLPALVKLLAG